MFSHSQIWQALDRLAEANEMSVSGLAGAAGLDATAFNKSKRETPHGRPRWPTTESVAKCLAATGISLGDFAGLVHAAKRLQCSVPSISMAQASVPETFDDAGRPAGDDWQRIALPRIDDPCAYALHVNGDQLKPVYHDGDILIVSPAAAVRPGSRVIVKTVDGEVLARRLNRDTGSALELACFDPQSPLLTVQRSDIKWIARIVWTSQ